MERLELKIIKKRILEMQRQSTADLEQTIDKAKMQHNYRASQLENIAKLCEDNLSGGFGPSPRLKPSKQNSNGSSQLEPKQLEPACSRKQIERAKVEKGGARV